MQSPYQDSAAALHPVAADLPPLAAVRPDAGRAALHTPPPHATSMPAKMS